jgi:arginine decarboxylase
MRKWKIEDSRELYHIQGWGKEYFDINDTGHVIAYPKGHKHPPVDLKKLVDEIQSQHEVGFPLLLRFPDIIDQRIESLSHCFETAAREYDYKGKYFSVFPIKVNQQKQVLEEVVRFGRKFNIGLEAGSKPELHAVLAMMDNPESIVICNGYKDREFIELALLAQKMGKTVFLVVEKLNELRLIHDISLRLNVKANIGIRLRIASSGAGRWEESGGDRSKFGLNASELMESIAFAEEKGILDQIRLIHAHLGSQITNIRRIKSGFREMAQFYVELKKLGCKLDFVDVGGGLGVDYDGSASSFDSSVNYTLQEYANDAVYALAETADKHELPHPHIISESGRALTAHHSVLIFNVLESTSQPLWDDEIDSLEENAHELVQEMYNIYTALTKRRLMESWHDILHLRDNVLELFKLGMIPLADRAAAEKIFWTIARSVLQTGSRLKHPPEDIEKLEKLLADKYFCNFSLFQSLPDSWAIDQLFPIMPIHRLQDQPTRQVTLQDITCDSDGRIDRFIGLRDYEETLPLHTFHPHEPYYLGVFLVGAYQEILGDLHNLFGDTNVVHVAFDEGQFHIEKILHGETVADVLEYVQFDPEELMHLMESWVDRSVKEGKLPHSQGQVFLENYRSGLYGYTYLEE